jgi:hypothetical protein
MKSKSTTLLTVFAIYLFQGESFADFSYSTLDYPGATSTTATGISQGIVVGYYSTSASYPTHGFIYDGNNYSPVDFPGSMSTRILDIDGNRMVGTYDIAGQRHAFVYDGNVFTSVDHPLTSPLFFNGSEAWGISGNKIVGYYMDDSAVTHGFVFDGAGFTTLNTPFSQHTVVTGIDGNIIVGNYQVGNGEHGFVYDGATYTTLDHPLGTNVTELLGIYGDQIVGWYSVTNSSQQHGFLFDGASFIPVNVPLAKQTVPVGIDGGMLVGGFIDQAGKQHGFVAVPELTTLRMLCCVLIASGSFRFRRTSLPHNRV